MKYAARAGYDAKGPTEAFIVFRAVFEKLADEKFSRKDFTSAGEILVTWQDFSR